MARFIMLHGFNTSDGGQSTVDELISYMRQDCEHLDYGNFGIIDVLRKNSGIAAELVSIAGADDIPIGHSNGCAIIAEAARKGGKFDTCVLINPALDKDYNFPEHVKHIYIYHTEHDKLVWYARLLKKFTPFRFIKDFVWGEMGRTGSTRNGDHRYVNVDITLKAGRKFPHTGIFNTNDNLEWLAKDIQERLFWNVQDKEAAAAGITIQRHKSQLMRR